MKYPVYTKEGQALKGEALLDLFLLVQDIDMDLFYLALFLEGGDMGLLETDPQDEDSPQAEARAAMMKLATLFRAGARTLMHMHEDIRDDDAETG